MNKTIKTIIFAAAVALFSCAFAASKKSIVCVTYPEYDWVMNILGDKAASFNVTLLQNNGTDLHSYQASIKDIAKISVCDMLVFVGGESDEWVEKAVAEAKNKNMIVVNMMEALGDKVKEEEVVEGMQAEEEDEHEEHDHEHEHADHDHDHDGHHHHHDEVEYDEHVWLSLRNAAALVETLAQKISELDSANAAVYKANAASYAKALTSLDAQCKKAVAAAAKKTILFGAAHACSWRNQNDFLQRGIRSSFNDGVRVRCDHATDFNLGKVDIKPHSICRNPRINQIGNCTDLVQTVHHEDCFGHQRHGKSNIIIFFDSEALK